MVPINNSPEGEGNFLKALIYCQQKTVSMGECRTDIKSPFYGSFSLAMSSKLSYKAQNMLEKIRSHRNLHFPITLGILPSVNKTISLPQMLVSKRSEKHKCLQNASNTLEIILLRGRLHSYSCKGCLYRLTVCIQPFSVQPINVHLA